MTSTALLSSVVAVDEDKNPEHVVLFAHVAGFCISVLFALVFVEGAHLVQAVGAVTTVYVLLGLHDYVIDPIVSNW